MSVRAEVLKLKSRIAALIIGQEQVIDRLLIALLANGNVLMEGLPGLAKTRAIKTLSKHVESEFRRIQFTPDLLPSDVTGTEVYSSGGGHGEFRFQPGPIFGNLILADEINRAPAKVQVALLEAMEERQVTVAGKTHQLPELFMVLATQNPIEQEGTYPLPEAQMDRFLVHVMIRRPSDADEVKILRLVRGDEAGVGGTAASGGALPQATIFAARAEVHEVKATEVIESYIVRVHEPVRSACVRCGVGKEARRRAATSCCVRRPHRVTQARVQGARLRFSAPSAGALDSGGSARVAAAWPRPELRGDPPLPSR